MTFGSRLQELRRKAGMSQDSLAERLEVSRQAVSKWERDETMPETDKVIRIAQLFDVSLDSLLLGRSEPASQTPPPHYTQQPQYTQQPRYTRPTFSQQFNQFLRRYGAKAGAVMTAIGAVICALCLLGYFLWPAVIGGVLGAPLGTFENVVQSSPNFEIYVDGQYSEVEEIPSWLIDDVRDVLADGPDYGIGGFIDSALDGMDSIMNTALRAQASLFLVGLLPGLLLIACGLFLIFRSRKLNTEALG